MMVDAAETQWMAAHAAQLDMQSVPHALRRRLFEKLRDEQFDAGNVFVFQPTQEDDSGRAGGMSLVPKDDLAQCSDIFLVDHAFLFSGLVEVYRQIEQEEAVRARLCRLFDKTEEELVADTAELLLPELGKHAHPIVLAGPSGQQVYWYLMDELGARVQQQPAGSRTINAALVPFYSAMHRTTFSLLWPLRNVDAGDPLVCEALPRIELAFLGREYWEARFEQEDEFEWYCDWEASRPYVLPRLVTAGSGAAAVAEWRVLVPGCGTSAFSHRMAVYLRKHGIPAHVLSVDNAERAVERMHEKYGDTVGGGFAESKGEADHEDGGDALAEDDVDVAAAAAAAAVYDDAGEETKAGSGRPSSASVGLHAEVRIEWLAADCTQLHEHVPSDSVDLVVDKGMLDALIQKPVRDRRDEGDTWLLYGQGSSDDTSIAEAYLAEMARVTRPDGDGALLIFTLCSPANLLPLLRCAWPAADESCAQQLDAGTVEHASLPIFCYTLVK